MSAVGGRGEAGGACQPAGQFLPAGRWRPQCAAGDPTRSEPRRREHSLIVSLPQRPANSRLARGHEKPSKTPTIHPWGEKVVENSAARRDVASASAVSGIFLIHSVLRIGPWAWGAAPSSRGTSVVPLPRPRRFARSIGARRRSLARVRRGTTDVCAPTRIGYVISRALRPDTLATFEVPIADDPPWAALSLSSLPKFFAPGLRVFVVERRILNGSSRAFVSPDYPNERVDPPCARELSRFDTPKQPDDVSIRT